jgi:hypothetical protein
MLYFQGVVRIKQQYKFRQLMWPTTCACCYTRWGIFENSKQFMKYQKYRQKDETRNIYFLS